jgi:hypothetical protein
MYGLRWKLVCLFSQVNVLSKPEDTNLLQSLPISCKLRIHNVLQYRHLEKFNKILSKSDLINHCDSLRKWSKS